MLVLQIEIKIVKSEKQMHGKNLKKLTKFYYFRGLLMTNVPATTQDNE